MVKNQCLYSKKQLIEEVVLEISQNNALDNLSFCIQRGIMECILYINKKDDIMKDYGK